MTPTVEVVEIGGAVCPECGSENLVPLRAGGAQCRSCLRHYPDIEVLLKEVY